MTGIARYWLKHGRPVGGGVGFEKCKIKKMQDINRFVTLTKDENKIYVFGQKK